MLLKLMFSRYDMDKAIQSVSYVYHFTQDQIPPTLDSNTSIRTNKFYNFFEKINTPHSPKIIFIGTLLLAFILLYSWISSIRKEPDNKSNSLLLNKKDVSTSAENKDIYDELTIPADPLERQDLIKQLQKCFSGTENIKKVALVGEGGAGKTTLAHMWGIRLKDNYPSLQVAEINAETKTLLSHSFKNLAWKLADKYDQAKELNLIDQINDPNEQERKRLEFIKRLLKKSNQWLLLYDNVNNLEDILEYLPRDPHAWGQGQIIITTRNSHIENTDIKPSNVIKLNPLKEEEATSLFAKFYSELSDEERNKIRSFLKNKEWFPSDISTAARYIKSQQISYEEYDRQLLEEEKNLSENQEKRLKKTSDYNKTRYSIVELASKSILKKMSCLKKIYFLLV